MGSSHGRNQLCQIFCWSVQGYRFCGALKFAYSHRNWRSPITLSELPFRLWYFTKISVSTSDHKYKHQQFARYPDSHCATRKLVPVNHTSHKYCCQQWCEGLCHLRLASDRAFIVCSFVSSNPCRCGFERYRQKPVKFDNISMLMRSLSHPQQRTPYSE